MLCLFGSLLFSESATFEHTKETITENQSLRTENGDLTYEVHTGTVSVPGHTSTETAKINYFAYFAKGPNRPIAFCFNGGPGSSSIWLHMGFLGPKIIDIQDLSFDNSKPKAVDNPFSLLSETDLVFIDPVSTGFSTSDKKESAHKFHNVEDDIYSIANFIRLFISEYSRWQSPKLLIGESYGTLRAVGVARVLQDSYFINIDGLGLISLVIDLETLSLSDSSPLSLALALPTLSSIAHYHQLLPKQYNEKSPEEIADITASFAIEKYAPALLLGSQLPPNREKKILQELSDLTSLPKDTLKKLHLQLSPGHFLNYFLRPQNQFAGTFDGRLTSARLPSQSAPLFTSLLSQPDPSFYAIASTFSAAFHEYLHSTLHLNTTEPYIVLSKEINPTWDWRVERAPAAGLGHLSLVQDLRIASLQNPHMKIFVASGLYDIATPFFAQKYTLSHLFLPEQQMNNIFQKNYPAGHMMYLHKPSRKDLFNDMRTFIRSACPR